MSDRFFCRRCGSEARFNERIPISFCPVHGVGFEIVRAPDPRLTGQRTLDAQRSTLRRWDIGVVTPEEVAA